MTELHGRWLTLEGAHNVRDLGGLTTASDRTTRSGVLLRSDALDRLTDADVATLVEVFGLRHVVDLRSSSERTERGRGPLGTVGTLRYTEVEVIPVGDLDRRRAARESAFARGEDPARIMADGYVELLEIGAPAFRVAAEAIAETDGAPALFHCAAGKDRTGVLAAVILGLLDVDAEVIAQDYHLSASAMDSLVSWIEAEFPEARSAMNAQPRQYLEAPIEAMAGFLDEVDRRYGSMEGLVDALGVSAATVSAIRDQLL